MNTTHTASLARPRPIVYADFSCAACYLASVRADQMAGSGQPVLDWRAVEHRPRLPLTGIKLSGAAQAVRTRALITTRNALEPAEEFEARNPGFLPNTRAAVAAYAEACEVGIPDRARHLLYDAYWVQGADIGNPEVLRRLLGDEVETARASADPSVLSGYVATAQHGPISTAAYRRIRDWQDAWMRLAGPVALTVVGLHSTNFGTSALRDLTPARVLAA